jgi:TonB-linked SusC/RagA family outer membrane protein
MYVLKQRSRLCLITLLLMLLSASAWSQDRKLTGTITDESGQRMPGATVRVPQTNIGTVTNIEGVFELMVPSGTRALEFGMIGMETQTITLGKQDRLKVSLSPSSAGLDEVVVIGYGSQNKKDVTGAISSVRAEELKNLPQPSVDQLLQGRAAGVVITQNSGQPGSASSVRIRGVTSLTGSNEPLYIIDGVPVSGDGNRIGTSGRSDASGFSWSGGGNGQTALSPLASINPADIVNIDILKDASAQAIYGSRAANGVIIITTKRGRSGESKITYDAYGGYQEPAKLLNTLNLQDYARLQNKLAKVYGTQPLSEFADPSLLGQGTDWQRAIFRRAPMQNHNLGISGGSNRLQYYFSAGYLNQDGMVIGSNFERLSTRLNIDSQVKDWFKFGTSITANRTNERITLNDDAEGVISRALLQGPDVPVKNPDGTYAGPPPNAPEAPQSNPVAQALDIQNNVFRNRVLGSIFADINFGKHLAFRTEVNGDFAFRQSPAFRPTYKWGLVENTVATAQNTFENTQWWVLKNYLTYTQQFGKHNVNAMVGHEAQESSWRGLNGVRANFPTNELPVVGLGDPLTAANSEYKGSTALESYYGRAIYSFDNRYNLTATLRADGSSKFDPAGGNQWGYFPSFSASWNVSNEKFLKGNKVLSNLRVRGGYGLVGNQDVPNYLYGVGLFQVQSGLGVGFFPDKIANRTLQWESARQANVGIETGFFQNRIELVVDVYRKESSDFLYRLPLPDYIGVTGVGSIGSPWVNIGNMENRGVDITLNTRNVVSAKLNWNSTLIFSHYRNKILDIQGLNIIEAVQFGFFPVTNTIEGQPIGMFWGLQAEGLFRNIDELNRAPIQFERPVGKGVGQTYLGDIKYKDVNGDGKVDSKDATFIGNPHPKFTYGFTNHFTFGNLDVNIFLQGAYGAKGLNFLRRSTEGINARFNNQTARAALFYDEEEGRTDTDVFRPVPGSDNPNLKVSSYWVEDISYLRIQNIQLGYSLPQEITRVVRLNRLKVYASIQNLRTFTKYSGLDPEIGNYNQKATLPNVDNGRYPVPRTFTFGVNAEF